MLQLELANDRIPIMLADILLSLVNEYLSE